MSRNDMDDQSQLCPSCSSIDFESAFALSARKFPWTGVPITVTRKKVQADCILCSCVVVRIFSDINTIDRVAAIGKIGYHFRAIGSRLIAKRMFYLEFSGSDVVVAIVRGDSGHHVDTAELLRAISLGLIVPLFQRSVWQYPDIPDYHYYTGRIVNRLSPDFTLIRSWIDECHSHVKCKSLREDMGFQSRVIDCWTRQIVPLTRDVEYLALSYVWGKAIDEENSQTFQTSGVVPFPAPKTIRDAMSVVRGMEKRYLWVDRYCIWESEDRHLQIQNMHQIYRDALSTIVPVEADGAGSGFSGVSSPRCDQFRFQTNAGLLVFSFPHISYHLSSSIWLTRGWTYQEAFLSRSCIFFTKDQVYFACRSGYQSEAVEQDQELPDAYQETLEPKLLSYADCLNDFKGRDYLKHFFYDHVNAYTSRSLTLDSDGLNAFEGIIKSWDTKSFWGIVSFRSDHSELEFAVGLAWSGCRKPPGAGPVRRREDFPTWSWVSLVDRIEHTLNTATLKNKLVTCSNFYIKDKNGHFASIANIYKRTAGSGALPFSNFGKALFIEANITQVHLLWSEKAGVCTVHAPKSQFPSEGVRSSVELRVKDVRARIDDDARLLSIIGTRPWSAVELFWEDEKVKAGSTPSEHYWMLVDEREPVAHRIGIITPASNDGHWLGDYMRVPRAWIRMEYLEAQRRLIRIE